MITLTLTRTRKKNNNNYNNLLQGSPNLLQEPERLSRRPSFKSSYYDDAVGANPYSSPKADYLSQGR